MSKRKDLTVVGTTALQPHSGVKPIPGITSDNYVKMATAFITAAGGMGFVLTPHVQHTTKGGHVVEGPTPEEAAAWRRYFDLKGMKGDLNGRTAPRSQIMAIMLRDWGCYTTPTQWPWDFDQSVDRDAKDP